MKKAQEREELHRAIRAIADELRGAGDVRDFKNHTLATRLYHLVREYRRKQVFGYKRSTQQNALTNKPFW